MAPVNSDNQTANHALNIWQQVPESEEDWQIRTDFEKIESRLPVVDLEANRGDYEAHDGAVFRARDTGALYIGNGTSWDLLGGGGGGLTAVRDASQFDGADGGEQIQAALDDLPTEGGRVFVPSEGPDTNGRWDVSSTIVVPSNTTLSGVSGATRLYLTDGTNEDVVSTATDATATDTTKENITIEGLHVDGNDTNQSDTSGTTYLYGSCGIRPLNVDDCTVRDCTVVDTYKHGIEVKRSKNVTVSNCTVGGAGDDGISVTDTLFDEAFSENITVENCRAYGSVDTGMEVDDGPRNVRFNSCVAHDNDGNGFVIHTHRDSNPPRGTETDTYSPAAPQEVYFNDCASVNNGRLGFAVGHHSSGEPRDYFLDGVYARGNVESPFREEITEASDSTVPIENVNVNNFYFEGLNQQNTGGGWTAAFKMDRAEPWIDVTISNGIITGSYGYAMNLTGCSIRGLTVDNVVIEGEQVNSYMIYMATSDNGDTIEDFRFTNCVCKDGPVGGFSANIAASDALINGQVANCTFKNNGEAGSGRKWDSGMILAGSGTLENVAFIGNVCYDDQGTPTQQYGIYRDTEDYCTFVGNICHGNEQAQFGGSLGANSTESANISR